MVAAKKLAQPTEKATSPLRMVVCQKHFGVHRERVTCKGARE